MSADIVSAVMLSIAGRTQQGVQVAVMRRAHQMEAQVLQMIDDVTATAPQPAPVATSRVDKRA